jgi:hypothetical protein
MEVWCYYKKIHVVQSHSEINVHFSEVATLLNCEHFIQRRARKQNDCCVGVSMTGMMKRSRQLTLILTPMSVGENISKRGMRMPPLP